MTVSEKSFNREMLFWMGVFVVFIVLVWLLNDILAPFVTGLAIAYLLNPAVTSLSRRVPRSLSSFLVLISFAVIVTGVIVLLSPMIARQVADLIANLPLYVQEFQDWIKPYIDKGLSRLELTGIDPLKQVANEDTFSTLLAGTKNVLPSLLVGGLALIGIGTFLVITPVVAFYCLRDWPTLIQKIDHLYPRDHTTTIRAICREFDARLAGFVRGQLLVCLSLGTFYAVALTIMGLNYGLAIGAIAGVLSFIPYVGSTFGFVASVGVALVQYTGFAMPSVAVVIFLIGQFIEGNFLTPKLVGERIGLHPVWVIFALMAGGKLFGFTGLLLAVPVAAMIGVLVRHGIAWYQQSNTYLGDVKK